MKIEKLTKEQIEKLPTYRDEFLKAGLATGPVDRAAAENAIDRAYHVAGLKRPSVKIWLRSPREGAYGAALLAGGSKFGDQVGDQVWAQVGAQVWAQVRAQVWAQVGDQVWAQVWAQVGAQVRAQVRDQVRDQVWAQVWAQVGAQVRAQVRDQVRAQVRDQVGDQVWAQVWDQVRAQVRDQVYRSGYGQHDANWLGFYAFFLREFGLDVCKRLEPIIDLSKNCGWWWPFEGAAILTERPTSINRDESHSLHCENGPALLYSDGFSIHAWRGVRVPAHWIEQRDNLDPAEVLATENVEQRAAGAEIVGWPKMLDKLDCKVINDSGSDDIGQLIELTLPGLGEPGRFLKARCPRNGIIVEGVPRTSDIDNMPIETALHAQAWRVGDPLSEYIHPERRT